MISFICGPLKSQIHRRIELWLPRTGVGIVAGAEEWGDIGERVQIFSYMMKMFWGSSVQHSGNSE